MRTKLKYVQNSHVWHYSHDRKFTNLADINVAMCGVIYRRNKQDVKWPICKRCQELNSVSFGSFSYTIEPVRVKLPKMIREQSFEPPERRDG